MATCGRSVLKLKHIFLWLLVRVPRGVSDLTDLQTAVERENCKRQ